MVHLLLCMIYVAFISLGLPDSLLGSAWPVMHAELGVPLSYAGIISFTISVCTIISSLMSEWVNKKLGTGLVTALSVLLTAAALFGFSVAEGFIDLCLIAVPYGLGAGSVDAALNNYVALHYSARHMNWLHCFWGVGAAVGPYVMGAYLTGGMGWQGGYRCIALIQIILTVFLFISLPIWKGRSSSAEAAKDRRIHRLSDIVRIRGAIHILIAFLGYAALEATAGMWASSYFVLAKGVSKEVAAGYASMFYIGITGGRFLSGFVAGRVGDRNMVRIGLGVILFGILLLLIPVGVHQLALAALILIGCGCAPIYPSIIHSTPVNFGSENSQALVGIQMAFAHIGSACMPPLFGLIARNIDIRIYPFFLLFFGLLTVVTTEKLNRIQRRKA